MGDPMTTIMTVTTTDPMTDPIDVAGLEMEMTTAEVGMVVASLLANLAGELEPADPTLPVEGAMIPPRTQTMTHGIAKITIRVFHTRISIKVFHRNPDRTND